MDRLSVVIKAAVQTCKRIWQQIKDRFSSLLKYQLCNNKPLALLCIAALGLLLFYAPRGLHKDAAPSDRKLAIPEAHTKILAQEPKYRTLLKLL